MSELRCIYAPNRNPDSDDFFVCCVNAVDPTVPTLLWGDFNTVLDRVVDHRGSSPFDVSRESSVMLSGLFSDCCVLDIWWELYPGVSAFTRCRPMGPLLPALTSSVARMSGCLMCLLWTFYPAPSPTIVTFPFSGPFPTLCLWARGC